MSGAESALVDSLLARADDRLILGHRLSEWCGHAPVLEEDLALANVALDLLGQAEALYTWLGARQSPEQSADALVFFRSATQYQNLLLVEQPNLDFANTVVRQFLYDSYDVVWLAAFLEHTACREEVAAWATSAQVEARYHLRHSAAWVRRLGDGTQESHTRSQIALDTLWTYTDEFFRTDALVDDDVTTCLRERWSSDVHSVFVEATLEAPELPPVPAVGGREGIHSEHLERLLSEMQSLARAHPGAEW